MLRSVDGWDSEHFSFGAAQAPTAAHPAEGATSAPTPVAIDYGFNGPSATIPDSHLLFTAQFSRAGADLVLTGEDSKAFVVHDYFATDARARLLSAEGAAMSPDVVAALAGPLAPGQYAQAGTAQPAVQAVGRVVQAAGDATIVRNGVAMAAHAGDAILKGDVLQTVTGTFGVTFNDGSTLNLTANSRLVVNEFVYDPKGSANSQLLNLVQGSLTFISGEVAHNGDMKIGTPVATMAIRGTVGGVTTANDGTVNFYVSQSATGAVILDSRGTIIANVVQDGPLIVVRPVGPLQVLAEEVQKSPAQLATELSALQQIVSIQSVGQQIIQQFIQQDPNATPNPNPQSTDKPHTQIQIEIPANPTPSNDNSHSGDNNAPPITATVTVITPPAGPGTPPVIQHDPITVTIPANLTPINFGPLNATATPGEALTFTGQSAISVFDADTARLTVTLSASHGLLTLRGVTGLTFIAGDGTNDAVMTFSGTQAAINAALDGLKFIPAANYAGPAAVSITTSDGNSTTAPETIDITVNANDGTIYWVSTDGGSWRDASNWNNAAVPGSQVHDDVKIILPLGETVALTGHDLAIGKLTVGADVTVEIVVDEELGIGSLDVFGAANNAGTISVGYGSNVKFHDTVDNSGTLVVAGSGHFSFYGDVTNTGTIKATAGAQINFTASLAGAVIINGGLVEFANAVGPQAVVTFDDNSSGGFLSLREAEQYGGQITNFSPGNAIDFGDFGSASWHIAGQTVVVTYDTEIGQTPVSYSITIGLSTAYSQDDFAIIPDATGGSELVFNDHWAPVGNSTDLTDPLNWSLHQVPNQNSSVTYDGTAILDLGGLDQPFHVAGLILGAHANVTIVNGTLDIGALDNSGDLTIGSIGEVHTEVDLEQPSVNRAGGSMLVTGDTSLYINGSFDNLGSFQANGGAQVTSTGTVTNEAGGTFNVLDGASFTSEGAFNNYGTALIDPATLKVEGDFHNTGTIEAGFDAVFYATGYVEGAGQFLISGGTMEFGGGVASNVTVSFGDSTSDKLILDNSTEFAGTLSGFGIGDEIVINDGSTATDFALVTTESGLVLRYLENGTEVSLALSGTYLSSNFEVSHGDDGGLHIDYVIPVNYAPVLTQTLLADNFDQENGGHPVDNYHSFENFTISGKTGLVGSGNGIDFDVYPGNGLYLDLRGSGSLPTTVLTSNTVYGPGTYTLEIDLGGTHRNSSGGIVSSNGVRDTTTISFGDYTESFSPDTAEVLHIVRQITVGPDSTATLVISDPGAAANTNIGNILLNVSVLSADAPHSVAYTEGHPAIAVDSLLTLSDSDSATLAGAKVTISAGYHDGDVLTFANQNGITGLYDAEAHVLTLSGAASVADYQAALRSVAYANTGDNPTADARTISFQVDDGSATNNLSNAVTATVNVTPVNDAPAVTVVGGVGQHTTGENHSLVFSGGNSNGISVSDPDTDTLTVTLAAAIGTLSLSTTAGLAFAQGDGHFDTSMTFTGTQDAINSALEGLRYKPATGFGGETSISVTADDDHLTSTTQIDVAVTPTVPTLLVADNTLSVTPGGTIALGISVFGHDSSDNLSVTITGLSSGDALTNNWHDHLVIGSEGAITLTAAQLFGLNLHVGSESQDNLSVVATNTEHGLASTSAAKTIEVSVDHPPVAVNDHVITNFGLNSSFSIPEWALLANDTDSDDPHSQLTLTGVSHASSGTVSDYNDTVTFRDTGGFGGGSVGSFDYTVSDGTFADTGHVTVSQDTHGTLEGTNAGEILVGNNSGSVINGHGGNDVLIGNGGADTFVFKPGDGADIVADFSGHAGQHDHIELDNFSFGSLDGLRNAATITDIGHGNDHTTLINFGNGNSITLDHVDPSHLSNADFVFHPHVDNFA